MSFRAKVALAAAAAVAIALIAMALAITFIITRQFEERDAKETARLVQRFRRELDVRGGELNRRVEAIASSQEIGRISAALAEPQPDTAQFLDSATAMAREQSLDFLTIASADGTLVSSAQWPVRFGYREEWLSQTTDWSKVPVFLKKEELPDRGAVGLFSVRSIEGAGGRVYVTGGLRLSQALVDSLVPGMSVQLWDGVTPPTADYAPIIEEVRKSPVETKHVVNGGRFVQTAIPLTGRDGQLLAVLITMYSREDLLSLVAYTRYIALVTGMLGMLVGVGLSWWTATHVTRPVRELAASVRQVASGNWETRAAIGSRDEIGRLAEDFNRMTAQLVEQKQRMVQAERVAAWRELARRLAHELKNPLFPLQITVENLQRSRQAAPEEFDEIFRESTATLLAELQNLKTIIGRFSDFAKMPAPQLERVDLNELARETMRFFRPQFQGRIEGRLELADDIPEVAADPEQMRRALRNLVLNAMDAIAGTGSITLRTQRQHDGAAIEVSDTGEGLTAEECERLFTPYYTTKQHGTGLGLAIVQSVVSDHHGAIRVRSEPGSGTTFRIELGPPA